MLKEAHSLRNFSIKLISCSSLLLLNEAATHCGIYMEKYNIKHFRLKKYLKTSMCSFLIFITFYTPVYADKQDYYIFSHDIYNQSKVLQRKNLLTEDELNKELKDELLCRKKEELGKSFLKRIDDSITILEEELREASKSKFRENIIEVVKSNTASLHLAGMLTGGAIGTAGGPLGTLIGLGIGIVAGTVAAVGSEFLKEDLKLNKNKKYQRDPQAIINKMAELKEKREELLAGLECEPIAELESAYVIKKRYMTDSGLQTEIERSLIQARVADYYFQLNAPTIGYALGLPFGPKPLLDSKDLSKSKSALIKRFEKDSSFSIYTKNIKGKLLEIVSEVANNSITSTSKSSLRVVEHFLGTGSTGKSTAAKEIARFLGLPYFEKMITSPETEINMTNISGSSRSFQGSANLGWLAEALLQRVDKKSYQNGFLILDDFPVNTQNGQNLLLSVTDPEKKTFFNDYFQADLNISRLNIIITSNEDFASLTPEKANNPTFNALRSRFDTITFPEFTETQKRIIATPYLEEDLVSMHKPPFFHKLKYVDPTQLEVSCDTEVLNDMGFKKELHKPIIICTGVDKNRNDSITLRELKRVLKGTINRYLIEIEKKTTKYFDRFKKEKDEKYLKLAAINGHPEAINMLVQQNLPKDVTKKKGVLRRIATGHEKNGNLLEAKELWIESFKLEDWDIWPQASKYLPCNPKSDEDKQLVEHLLTFAKKHDKNHTYATEIGNYLHQVWCQFTKDSDKIEHLKASAKLGNQDAVKALEQEEEKSSRINMIQNLPVKLNSEVDKNVQRLSTLKERVLLLAADKPETQVDGFDQLFFKDDGEITNLWSTQRWNTAHIAVDNDSNYGLVSRVSRFEKQEERTSVITFHLRLVKSLTDRLLATGSHFYKEFQKNKKSDKNKVVRKNIMLLRDHLTSLNSLGEDLPSQDFNETTVNEVSAYIQWLDLNNSKGDKAKLLEEHYQDD